MNLVISPKTLLLWSDEDLKALDTTDSVEGLVEIANRILAKMPKPFVQVCGPIASGGLGSIEKNLEAFNKEIHLLQEKGFSVFDQMPFEMPMQRLKSTISKPDDILDLFYLPLFKSGNIGTCYFMPNWQSSYGATWEHKLATELQIPIVYL